MHTHNNTQQKAIFLDRDGVINVEKEYLHTIEEFEFIDGVIEALLYLQSLGFALFVITNQSGIARGYYKEEDFIILTQWMVADLAQAGVVISRVEFCPHGPNSTCNCRKPKIGMIEQIALHHSIDFSNSWIIGDKQSDIECGKNSGIGHSIQVRSGHTFESSIADYVIDKLDRKSIETLIF